MVVLKGGRFRAPADLLFQKKGQTCSILFVLLDYAQARTGLETARGPHDCNGPVKKNPWSPGGLGFTGTPRSRMFRLRGVGMDLLWNPGGGRGQVLVFNIPLHPRPEPQNSNYNP